MTDTAVDLDPVQEAVLWLQSAMAGVKEVKGEIREARTIYTVANARAQDLIGRFGNTGKQDDRREARKAEAEANAALQRLEELKVRLRDFYTDADAADAAVKAAREAERRRGVEVSDAEYDEAVLRFGRALWEASEANEYLRVIHQGDKARRRKHVHIPGWSNEVGGKPETIYQTFVKRLERIGHVQVARQLEVESI